MDTAFVHEQIVAPSVEGNPRNGEGDAIELADGRLLMIYGEFYGTADHAPATLQGLISRDRGRTWQDKHLVQENIADVNVMSVSLARLASGDILLVFIRKDDAFARLTPYVRRSADEGATWSAPEPVVPISTDYCVVNNDRLVQLGSGRILLPSCIYDGGRPKERRPHCNGAAVFMSDDNGHTWRRTAIHRFLPESKSGPQEPGVIELADGRVMMWVRCDLGQIYRCHSEDAGETFGAWGHMGLESPVSPSALKRLPSTGDLLCVYNNHGLPPKYALSRTPLTAALSRDDGATWHVVGDLEPDTTQSYCYTSVTFISNDEVFLTYYLGSDREAVVDGETVKRHCNLAHLKTAVFEEKWLCREGA